MPYLNGAMVTFRWLRQLWMPGPSRRRPAALSAPSVLPSSLEPLRVPPDEPQLPDELPGRLIIVEGIDGSGKSTHLDLLRKCLVNQGYLLIFSEWNSSPIVKITTRRGKPMTLLPPSPFTRIHAADFPARTSTRS